MTMDDDEEPQHDIVDRTTNRARMCARMCDTCIMRPGSVVTESLRPGRLKQLLADVRANESWVVCHSTFGDQPAICRGVADAISTNYIRVMGRLGAIVEIEPPSLHRRESL